ncbi:MAG: GerAB/ArcD/ProY family transporter [Clostridia bacterium]|nr:GerAB/ArcD/ProY family transporter [Clostridia bacterium]
MKIVDRSINAWQLGIMLFILLFANKILVLPSLLYDDAKLEGFFVPVILFAFEIGILLLFRKLKIKYPNESFASVLQKHFGKVAKMIVYVLMLIFFISKAVLLYNVTYIFFRNMIYKDSGNFIFLFSLLPVVIHMVVCGLRVMGRTMQLFFPPIVVITVFCVVVGFFGITENVPLLFEGAAQQLLFAGLKHISSFGDIIFVFAVMDKVKIKKGQWKVVFSLASAAAVMVVVITVLFMVSFSYTSFMHPYAIFEIMSIVKEYGGIGRVDIISMVLIIIYSYFHLAIYLKGFMLSFQEVFLKLDASYGLIAGNLVFLIVVNFLIINLEKAVTYAETILPYFAVVPFVVVPAVGIVLLFMKKRKREDET